LVAMPSAALFQGGFEEGSVAAAGGAAVVAGEVVLEAVGDALGHDVGDAFVEAEGLTLGCFAAAWAVRLGMSVVEWRPGERK
jgi:hypothetical protein